MKIMAKLVVLILGICLSLVSGRQESNCGSLEERLLFSKDVSTEPAEYPWMGILFQRRGNSYENTRCSVVIVSDSHVLTVASCVRRFNNQPASAAVRLGIWNETHTTDEKYICNAKGFCVPGPVQHLVAEIREHPQADKDTGNNDLAILRLEKRIKWTTYMQPLCLQPYSEPASIIDRNYHFGGFEHSNYIKGKGEAFTISRQYCKSLSGSSSAYPETQFCGYPVKRTKFYEGAALLGLNIEDDVPRSFYLVGLLVKVWETGQTTIFVFQDITPLRRWLIDNTLSANS